MRDDDFEWDDAKAKRNFRKHGVTFDEAREAFEDRNAVDDIDDDPDEERWALTAMTSRGLLYVIYTHRGHRIRIISAREAERHEQDDYHRQARP